MTKEPLNEISIRKKKVLTRWLFFVLLFNVFLQFEQVEETFNTLISQAEEVSQSQTLCGTSPEAGSPDSKGDRIHLASLIGVSSTNTLQSISLMAAPFSGFKQIEKQSNLGITHGFFISERLTFESSGLSPPLA